MAIGGTAVLSLAAWLTPSDAGLGTHEQLRMPACGWVSTLELPCPTCGMTTAFAHAADGNLLQSALTQPLGCILALLCAMAVIVGVYVAVTGSPVLRMLGSIWRPRLGWMMLAVAMLAWGYKILSFKGVLG